MLDGAEQRQAERSFEFMSPNTGCFYPEYKSPNTDWTILQNPSNPQFPYTPSVLHFDSIATAGKIHNFHSIRYGPSPLRPWFFSGPTEIHSRSIFAESHSHHASIHIDQITPQRKSNTKVNFKISRQTSHCKSSLYLYNIYPTGTSQLEGMLKDHG